MKIKSQLDITTNSTRKRNYVKVFQKVGAIKCTYKTQTMNVGTFISVTKCSYPGLREKLRIIMSYLIPMPAATSVVVGLISHVGDASGH